MNKKELLELLDNEEIQTAILAIKKSKNQKKNNFKNILKEKDEKIEMLESIVEKLKNEIKEMKSQRNKLFEKELSMYALYEELSSSTKVSLRGIFKDDSLKGFLVCGLQERNISCLWDYVKNELREEKNADIESLKTIFYFFFKGYTKAYPMYQVQKVKVGDVFDTEENIKTNASSVSGKIDEVVFLGWVNAKTKKIVKKSIVRVK